MQKGLMAILGVLAVAFVVISLQKRQTVTEEKGNNPQARSEAQSEIVDFWKHYQKATDLRTSGAYEASIPYYENAIELNPSHKNSLYYLGNMHLAQERYREAETAWNRLLALNKKSARAYMQLGTLYGCRDSLNTLYDLERSEQQYLEAHSLNREETGPMLKLAELNILRQSYEAADTLLNDVAASNFRSSEAFFLRGYLAWLRSDNGNARQDLSRSVAIIKGTAAENVGEGETESSESVPNVSRCEDTLGYYPFLKSAAHEDWTAEHTYHVIADSLF